jgi:mono/diheme cytochrome c family protein
MVSCASTPTANPSPAITHTNDGALAQIDQGKKLYVQYCAGCHGNGGEGTAKAPPVVGAGAFPLVAATDAKRNVPFHTAADVFTWTVKHMPADAPGSLSTEQYLAIFAFDLTANGVKLSAPLDAAKAAAIVLHP